MPTICLSISWSVVRDIALALGPILIGAATFYLGRQVRNDARMKERRAIKAALYAAEGEFRSLAARCNSAMQLIGLDDSLATVVDKVRVFPRFALSAEVTQAILRGDVPESLIKAASSVSQHAQEADKVLATLTALVGRGARELEAESERNLVSQVHSAFKETERHALETAAAIKEANEGRK